ncbi:MAG: glycerol-3-phosphate 1-O-acyltransferase PlsY [Bdellovibrionales bacterium]
MKPEILVATSLAAYLIGSVPFGLLLTRIAGLGDIRAIGSGNIGATNVLRTGNKKLAALTLLLDGLKGALAVLALGAMNPEAAPVAAFCALLGHVFPVWLKFKGGKGVATSIGAITALCWPAGLAVMATWLAVAFAFRYSSLAALVAIALMPVYGAIWGGSPALDFGVPAAMLVYFTHRDNIKRLIEGREPKIKLGKSKTP